MDLFVFDIGEKARAVGRFIGEVRAELQMALAEEKRSRKLTQQKIATMIGTDRAVINRQLMGFENLTLKRVAELAWAMGWDIVFYLRKPAKAQAVFDARDMIFPPSRSAETSDRIESVEPTQINKIVPLQRLAA